MEMIERYLQAVKFWLPRQQRDDIIAELADDIQAQLEEQETTLGRKLNEAEVEELLKQRGHPLLVANRFQPRESLIGPALFPVYRFILKVFAFGYLTPSVLVWIGLMTFSPAYRAGQTHVSWFTAFASLFGHLWITTCTAVFAVTLAFAVLERMQARIHFFDRWSPRKLPPVRNPNLIPRFNSSFELAANLIFSVWFAVYLHSPVARFGSAVQIALNPIWPWFFWSYLLLAAFNAALACEKLLHPSWTVRCAAVKLLADAAGAALFCWLIKADILACIAAPDLPAQQAVAITQAINGWMARIFPAAIVLGLVIVATDVYRIVRLRLAAEHSSA